MEGSLINIQTRNVCDFISGSLSYPSWINKALDNPAEIKRTKPKSIFYMKYQFYWSMMIWKDDDLKALRVALGTNDVYSYSDLVTNFSAISKMT